MDQMPGNAAQPPTAGQPASDRVARGCGIGCAAVIILLVIAAFIGSFLNPDPSSPRSDAYGAGRQIGFVEGNMAYNGGSTKADTAQLDAAGRRATANVPFKKPEDREEWIRGFKDGYQEGWNRR